MESQMGKEALSKAMNFCSKKERTEKRERAQEGLQVDVLLKRAN